MGTELPAAEAQVWSGGCQCGAVRFRVHGQPAKVELCHCRMCQKAMAGPFFAYVTAAPAAVQWTRGEPAYWRSSAIARRAFCAACGTPLGWVSDETGDWDLSLGAFDNAAALTPTAHLGVESRLPWVMRLGVEHWPERLTRPAPETVRSRQHPDHDTP
ncbi:MAG TPA: GFA family protein [Acidisphaera sp.]|nr:GFA family protein [Acidisphaera sp.]